MIYSMILKTWAYSPTIKSDYRSMSPLYSKEEAIEDFTEMANLDKKVAAVISKVLSRSPSAILIAWEEEGSVKATSIPFSACLVKGMVDTLFDMVFGDKDDDDDESDEQAQD